MATVSPISQKLSFLFPINILSSAITFFPSLYASDEAGVELDERGYIRVNERLETTASGVWAVGDCAGSPQFTHVGFDDFRIVRDNWNGRNRTTRDRLVPYCVFTDPQLARVGLNEKEAKSAGVGYRIARIPMAVVLRARAIFETRGFLKALIDAHSDRILGFTALGAEAGELIAVVQTAMLTGAPYTVLRDAILTHPTIAEGLNVLFQGERKRRQRRPHVSRRACRTADSNYPLQIQAVATSVSATL